MKSVHVIGLVALVAVLTAGCATRPDEAVNLSQGGGMYSALDATAQVYSNPMAQAPIEDHPFRWFAYLLHPIGVTMDYIFNRPIHATASTLPTVSGYTSEDALISSQRRK